MHKLDEQGSLLLPLIAVLVLLFGASGFAAWAFMERQDYKNNVDAKIEVAVEEANETLSDRKDAEFAEQEKLPYRTYQGPSALGSVSITYPKTWSAYVSEDVGSNIELDGYMHPNFVPSVEGETSFALRVQVVNQTYDQVIKTYDSKVRSGKITAAAYRAPKVESELGAKLSGEIDTKKQGIMVLFPTRDKTIKIWTEGQDFGSDFNTVLESLTYIP